MNNDEKTTPDLVRRFATWKVLESHRLLDDFEVDALNRVIVELKRRGVLD